MAVKLATVLGAGLVLAVASSSDVIITVFTFLNTLLLLVTSVLTQRNRVGISAVQDTAEKTFQSTTHAANAAEGAARSAAISTIVASKHLGIDMRDEDLQRLTDTLRDVSTPDVHPQRRMSDPPDSPEAA